MDATTVRLLLSALVCPLAMGALMWMMMRQTGEESPSLPTLPTTPGERLTLLRAQRDDLEAEIAELTQVARLEAERDDLRAAPPRPHDVSVGSAD